MNTIDKILDEFYETGVDTRFEVKGKQYQVFAYRSPGRARDCVRWNLYELKGKEDSQPSGLTFGVADGVREALEDVVRAAECHAETGAVDPVFISDVDQRPRAQD